MRITLLGTGGPVGWPEPGCPCASCERGRTNRVRRAPTAVLVDDELLLPLATDLSDGAWTAVGRHRVRRLAGRGPGRLLDVDGRLLFAEPGAVPDRMPGRTGRYDVAVVGLTDCAATLSALRASGAADRTTRVVAAHLGHPGPLDPTLAGLPAAWGVELPADGTVIELGEPAAPAPSARRTLVLGGARSGKSAYAEALLAAEPAVTYVATWVVAEDPSGAERIAAHRARRPAYWRTVETTDLVPLIREPPTPLLIDCLSLWLGAHRGKEAGDAPVDALLAAWRATPGPVVAVSNEVGGGVVPSSAAGRDFRDRLGRLNARLAAESDAVWLVTAGIPRRLA